MKSAFLLTGFVIFTLLGNYFFKRGAGEVAPLSFDLDKLVAAICTLSVWGGITFYGLAAIFWFASLTTVPLNLAITVSACIYVVVILMAFVIFQEPIPPMRWTGIALIFTGLVIVGRTL